MSPINHRQDCGEQSPIDFSHDVLQGRIDDADYSVEDVDSSDDEVEVDHNQQSEQIRLRN